jgi:hypothetical protein
MLDRIIEYRKYRAYLGVVVGDERITQSTDLTVHDKTLEITGHELVMSSKLCNIILTGGQSAGR